MTTPSYVNSGAADNRSNPGVDLTPGLPASLVSGNLLLAEVLIGGAGRSVATPTGWTLINDVQHSGDDLGLWLFGRISDGTETAVAFDWNSTGNRDGVAVVHQYTGNVTTSVAAAIEAYSETEGSDTSIEIPSITAGGNERLAVAMLGCRIEATFGDPSGETGGTWAIDAQTSYATGDLSIAALSAALATGGTISGGVSTATGTNIWLAQGFAIVGASSANSASGTPQAQAADATGTLAAVASLSGTPQAGAATTTGQLQHVALLSGTPQAGTATAAGTIGNQSVMSGAPQAGAATATGVLALIASLQGAAQADAAVSTGAATLIASMSGDAAAGFATADGFIDDGMAPTPVARRAPLMLVDVGRMMGR